MPDARMALVPKDTDSTGSTPRADTGIMPQVHRRDQEGDGSGTGVEPRKCGFGRRASDTQPRRAAAVDLFEREGTGRAATTDQGLERRKCGVTWQLAYLLSRVVEGKRAEIRQRQHDLRHEEIVVDVAWNDAAQLGQGRGSATPAPSHGQSSLHILKAKAAKAVLADHKPDKVQTMQQRTKAREESWTLDAERLR